MADNPLVKGIVADAENRLASLKEALERTASESVEVVERAKRELLAVEEATEVGASKTFMGASVMLVGVTEYPLHKPQFTYAEGRPMEIAIDHGQFRPIRLHGDPEALNALRGNYKAIVLLFQSGPAKTT